MPDHSRRIVIQSTITTRHVGRNNIHIQLPTRDSIQVLSFPIEMENQISALVTAYVGLPLGMFVVFQNMRGLYVTIIILFVGTLTEIIKYMTRKSKYKCLKRPVGATDCDISNSDGDQSGKPGFPSGHCATSAAFWICVLAYIPPLYRKHIAVVGSIMTLTMMWARTKKKCHTLL